MVNCLVKCNFFFKKIMLNLREKIEKIKKIVKSFKFKKPQLVGVGILVVVLFAGFQIFGILKSKGATFGWVQSTWSGGADTNAVANHNANQTNWTKFYSKDANVDTSTSGEVKLSGTASLKTETTDADFNTGTNTNAYVAGTGSGGAVYAKKPDGGTCTTNNQCTSGFCSGGTHLCSYCGGTVTGGSGDANTYGMVVGVDGQCWLDRNLGATRVAISKTDTSAYGWYYQWGRATDGHQLTTSSATLTLSPTDTVASPDTAKFIVNNTSPYDWRTTKNDNLWQGVTGVNNPCPIGYRLPTSTEWTSLLASLGVISCNTTCDDKLFNSNLKITLAGNRNYSGTWYNVGANGTYWSSSPLGTNASVLTFPSNYIYPADTPNRAYGFSVRCLKN